MLREQREGFWILAEKKLPGEAGLEPCIRGAQTAPGFLLDLPHRSMAIASMLANSIFPRPIIDLLAVSVSSANLISNFPAIGSMTVLDRMESVEFGFG